VPTETGTPEPSATDQPAAAPSATRAPTETPTAEARRSATPSAIGTQPATPAGGESFVPTAASIWNTALVGGDTLSGECSGPVNPPYGLVLITPAGDTLTWHNTVPEDYLFTRTGTNSFAYSGPTGIGDGTVTMNLTFTAVDSLVMTRAFVSNAEPACTHNHQYSGAFQYFR
jgi:hypothetical protein